MQTVLLHIMAELEFTRAAEQVRQTRQLLVWFPDPPRRRVWANDLHFFFFFFFSITVYAMQRDT